MDEILDLIESVSEGFPTYSWLVILSLTPESESQKKDTRGIPPLKGRNGSGLAESELEQADEFNGYFTNVFDKSEHTQLRVPNRSALFI